MARSASFQSQSHEKRLSVPLHRVKNGTEANKGLNIFRSLLLIPAEKRGTVGLWYRSIYKISNIHSPILSPTRYSKMGLGL